MLRRVVEQSERREHHLRLATPWVRAGPGDVWLGPSPLLEIQHPDVVAPVGVKKQAEAQLEVPNKHLLTAHPCPLKTSGVRFYHRLGLLQAACPQGTHCRR